MKIYILKDQEELVTEDPDLTARWETILALRLTDQDYRDLVTEFDELIIEKFGPGSRFLGSES